MVEGRAAHFALQRRHFGEREREAVSFGGLKASLFRYDSGVEAIRLSHARGHVIVLPYLGQMVWSAVFDGVELAMQSMYREPRPAKTIVETYGCLAYHAGILRMGVPGPADNHALHGEAPCAEMDKAGVSCGVDADGAWIAVTGEREYAMGFGPHYMLARKEGDAFAIAWDPTVMNKTIRWVLANSDQRVAAFAMPATCEPEGYTAEKRKGHVRALAGGARIRFATHVGYVDKTRVGAEIAKIEGLR